MMVLSYMDNIQSTSHYSEIVKTLASHKAELMPQNHQTLLL